MNCIFGGGGRGREGQINKYVWEYDEIMIFFFYVLWSHFYQFGAFMVKVQIWKIFLGLLNFKYFWGVPDIPDIFGDKELMLGPSLRI